MDLQSPDAEFSEIDAWIFIAAHSLFSSFWYDPGHEPPADLPPEGEPNPTAGKERDATATDPQGATAEGAEVDKPQWVAFTRSSFEKKVSATSSYRSINALLEFCRFAEEEDLYENGPSFRDQRLARLIRGNELNPEVLVERLSRASEFLMDDRSRDSSANERNMFSDSHALLALAEFAALLEFVPHLDAANPLSRLTLAPGIDRPSGSRDALKSRAMDILQDVTDALALGRDGQNEVGGRLIGTKRDGAGSMLLTRNMEQYPVHDFITLSAVRGADSVKACFGQDEAITAFERELSATDMAGAVRNRILAQEAYFFSGADSRFDVGDLLCSAALINRFAIPNGDELRRASLKIARKHQGKDGGWSTSRVLALGAKRVLHIASYEFGLALTYSARHRLDLGDATGADEIIPLLDRVFELIKRRHVIVPVREGSAEEIHGWSNDHTQVDGLIESWATAVVLMFLLRYRRLLGIRRQVRAMDRYSVRSQPLKHRSDWVDLRPYLRGVDGKPQEVRVLTKLNDPTDEQSLAATIVDLFVRPVRSSVAERPGPMAALLVDGPPGTGKTTLVSKLAEELGWPLLTLTPADFLVDGLEGIERRAAEVFKDLCGLRRVVILFDECDEFLKSRPHESILHASRTMGAFLTAGMLPRLQSLRNRGWVVFLAATNALPSELDSAAIRPGRFDRRFRLGHPGLAAQRIHIDRLAADRKKYPNGAAAAEAQALLGVTLTEIQRAGKGDDTTLPFKVLENTWNRAYAMADSAFSEADIQRGLAELLRRVISEQSNGTLPDLELERPIPIDGGAPQVAP